MQRATINNWPPHCYTQLMIVDRRRRQPQQTAKKRRRTISAYLRIFDIGWWWDVRRGGGGTMPTSTTSTLLWAVRVAHHNHYRLTCNDIYCSCSYNLKRKTTPRRLLLPPPPSIKSSGSSCFWFDVLRQHKINWGVQGRHSACGIYRSWRSVCGASSTYQIRYIVRVIIHFIQIILHCFTSRWRRGRLREEVTRTRHLSRIRFVFQ